MKSYLAQIQAATQTSYANNGKTTITGRAFQKTINSQTVIGPGLTNFIDVQTLVGFSPQYSFFNPTTNRLFVVGPASATPTIALFNFNNLTGAYSYVGKIVLSLANAAATTYTFRGFKVYESGGLIYPILSTTASVVVNGGTYVGWSLSVSDFTVGGTTLFAASASGQKAVYFLQDPVALGQAHVATTGWGVALPYASSSSVVNTKVWQFNGTLALPQLYSWDLSGTANVAGSVISGVGAQTTAYTGTSPVAYFQMAAQNGYSVTAGDAVVLMAGTGNPPANYNAWVSGTAQVAASNVYFVRDLQNISGNWQFNLSTTAGGAAVVPTTATSNFTMMRAFGINSSLFSLKTGVLPAFTLGTLLQNNSLGYAKPFSAPANTNLNGQDCLYLMTSLGLYMGKISDLTSLGTTWGSMTFSGINVTGTGIDITAPAVANGSYSGQNSAYDIDRFIFTTNTSTFVIKPYQASNISTVFGGLTDTYYETLNPVTTQTGLAAISDLSMYGGWMFICGSTAGQRGVVFADIYSDSMFGASSVITPVLTVPAGSTFKFIDTLEQLFDYTDSVNFYVRSAATSTDPLFSSASGGWTLIKTTADLSATSVGPAFQLMAQYQIATLLANTPAQIQDLRYTISPPTESSDNWVLDNDNTTQGTASPSYVSFYLQSTYSSSVPTLYARVYDTSGNLIFSANTSTGASAFQYSANGGTSWSSLGTIPNSVGTRVRALVTPTPSSLASASIRET